MSIITKPYTYSAGAIIYASEQNANHDVIYADYNGGITNANLSASANIQDSKLATISTAGKVSGAALTSLTSVPSGAGKIPIANISKEVPFLDTVVVLTDGATPALDASLGNIFTLAAAGDRTIAVPSNATSGQKIIIRHLASGGARTLSLNTGAGGFRFGSDITALTQTASGKYDYIGCIYNAVSSTWDVVAYAKGY